MNESPGRQRLFVAVDVPAQVRDEIATAASALRAHLPEARWTDPGGWHVTLAFLGWVQAERAPEIAQALAAAADATPAFPVTLSGRAGSFGGRVLWVGFREPGALETLAGRVQSVLEPLGFPPEERPFHAHVTLARARGDGRLRRGAERRYAGPTSTWEVGAVRLMRSELARGGARYIVRDVLPLNRGAHAPRAGGGGGRT